jgi:hypothetical protein
MNVVVNNTPCGTKAELLSAQSRAIEDDNDAVKTLKELAGTGRDHEFNEARAKAETTGYLARKASEALQKHCSDHGC